MTSNAADSVSEPAVSDTLSVAASETAMSPSETAVSFADELDPPELVPARMLTQFLYCSRLFYLEWVNQQWDDNAHTAQGEYVHRAVDRIGGAAPAADDDNPFLEARSLKLSSEKLGLVAVVDLVEGKGGEVHPVDYKKAKLPGDLALQTWESHRAQLCVAGLLLREAGYVCTSGSIYYAGSKRRVEVNFDDELIDQTMSALEELRETATLPEAPPPLVDSPKCPDCSLVGICLPDEVNLLAEISKHPPRRLVPRDPQSRPVYVAEQGARVGKAKGRLQIKKDREVIQEVRLLDVSQLCLYGNVQVSSQCVRELLGRDVPICWFSFGGWFAGMATGLPAKHVELRRRQVGRSSVGRMDISKAIVRSKILNSRTLLRRNFKGGDEAVHQRTLASLKYLGKVAGRASTVAELMGVEGAAARDYFQAFNSMLREEHGLPGRPFSFEGRNRRPPLDPINCLLSYCYSLLTKELTVVAHAVGFDPYIGFFHKPRFGRPALALDLAEEFRPLVADSVVITLINNDEIRASDFVVRSEGVALTDAGKKKVLGAYERRLDVEITHPVFDYKITYRRVFELQARLLAATLLDEVAEYTPFATR